MPHDPQITQQHGLIHGGVVGMIADSAGGYAAYSLFPADSTVMTVEYKLNLMAPAEGERLLARRRVTRHGRTLTIRSEESSGGKERGKTCKSRWSPSS